MTNVLCEISIYFENGLVNHQYRMYMLFQIPCLERGLPKLEEIKFDKIRR